MSARQGYGVGQASVFDLTQREGGKTFDLEGMAPNETGDGASVLPIKQPLSAEDVQAIRVDRRPWDGKVFDEVKIDVLTKVLRSIAEEQPGANSAVKALAAAGLEAIADA